MGPQLNHAAHAALSAGCQRFAWLLFVAKRRPKRSLRSPQPSGQRRPTETEETGGAKMQNAGCEALKDIKETLLEAKHEEVLPFLNK